MKGKLKNPTGRFPKQKNPLGKPTFNSGKSPLKGYTGMKNPAVM